MHRYVDSLSILRVHLPLWQSLSSPCCLCNLALGRILRIAFVDLKVLRLVGRRTLHAFPRKNSILPCRKPRPDAILAATSGKFKPPVLLHHISKSQNPRDEQDIDISKLLSSPVWTFCSGFHPLDESGKMLEQTFLRLFLFRLCLRLDVFVEGGNQAFGDVISCEARFGALDRRRQRRKQGSIVVCVTRGGRICIFEIVKEDGGLP